MAPSKPCRKKFDTGCLCCQLAGWDLSRETLSKIEAGLRRVNDAEVMMLAKVLGCELKDMFPANIRPVLPVLRHSK
ncbi:MAG TPA: helix-turn-helix transcriptional regulator [Prosthecobacter sp.]|nr:helix-turn-helix transcriptional regulator [Prosthecobacter sp.]